MIEIQSRNIAQLVVSQNVRVRVWDGDFTHVVDEFNVRNRYVDAGLNLLRDYLVGDSNETVTHIAAGTDGTAVAAGDTALGAEVYRAALTKTVKSAAKEVTFKLFINKSQANGNTLREAALVTDPAAGTMPARVVFTSEIEKDDSKGVEIDWTIRFEYKSS